eukprot:Platyproteum_vivax@DN16188_c0_g1_i1.p1
MLGQIGRKAIMTITDKAAKRIKFLMRSKGPETIGIKIGLKRRGCNGLSYTMNYASSVDKLDEQVRDKGVNIVVDKAAVMFLIGTELDYHESELISEFVFTNPNQKGSCGCGQSFNV